MNFTIVTEAAATGFISRALFSGETKKEEAYAARINSFYDRIITAVEKISKEKGSKCFIDISAAKNQDIIIVCFSLRMKERGRTLCSISDTRQWKDGIIIKEDPAVENIQSNNKKKKLSVQKCTKQ